MKFDEMFRKINKKKGKDIKSLILQKTIIICIHLKY